MGGLGRLFFKDKNMRTKTIKNGKEIYKNALLLCGGFGCKVYGHENSLIVTKGRMAFKFTKEDEPRAYSIIQNFANVKYANIDEKESIIKSFENWSYDL